VFFIDLSFLVNNYFGHSRAWSPACSPTEALLHRCSPSNLSTTMQGAIVKLRGELLQSHALCCVDQCGTVKLRIGGLRTVLGYVGKRGWGVEGYGCLRMWVQ